MLKSVSAPAGAADSAEERGGCTHTELWYLLGVSDVINEAMKHPSCSGCLPLVCTPSQDYVCVRVCVLFWSSLLNLRSEACARLHA